MPEVSNKNAKPDEPVGPTDITPEEAEQIQDATWGEVFSACCVHSPAEWGYIFAGFLLVLFFLYFFLFGLEILGESAKVMSACTAGSLFGDDTNPIAGLMVGILATVLLQSSSTTTSIVVSLVGADAVGVREGIYMIMGANIGTSVTNTIVAIGHLGDGDQLERAFAGATVHDVFNFLSVIILLPVEAATGYLYHLTGAITDGINVEDGEKWDGPLKKIVDPLGARVILSNGDVVKAVAKGGSCDDFYPIVCDDIDNPTNDGCSQFGLIECDGDTNRCPAFFQADADQADDQLSGLVVFIIAVGILFVCLFALVTILNKMLLGASTRIIYKATNINGYIAIVVGAGITILVQSSSITTSALTPLVGADILRLEQMLPLSLGANIGTTVTALLASLVSDSSNSLQVALAHLFFNVTGILIWYPIPFMRNIVLNLARKLGKGTRIWRGFPVVYILVMFFVVPLIFLGISSLFTAGSKGLTVLGSFVTVLLFFAIVYTVYNCKYQGGQQKCLDCMENRQKRAAAVNGLPDHIARMEEEIRLLKEHTGMEQGANTADEKKKLSSDSSSTNSDV